VLHGSNNLKKPADVLDGFSIDPARGFWGLHIDAVGIVAILAALLIVLVFALLLALRF
jgi:hypothetical protein